MSGGYSRKDGGGGWRDKAVWGPSGREGSSDRRGGDARFGGGVPDYRSKPWHGPAADETPLSGTGADHSSSSTDASPAGPERTGSIGSTKGVRVTPFASSALEVTSEHDVVVRSNIEVTREHGVMPLQSAPYLYGFPLFDEASQGLNRVMRGYLHELDDASGGSTVLTYIGRPQNDGVVFGNDLCDESLQSRDQSDLQRFLQHIQEGKTEEWILTRGMFDLRKALGIDLSELPMLAFTVYPSCNDLIRFPIKEDWLSAPARISIFVRALIRFLGGPDLTRAFEKARTNEDLTRRITVLLAETRDSIDAMLHLESLLPGREEVKLAWLDDVVFQPGFRSLTVRGEPYALTVTEGRTMEFLVSRSPRRAVDVPLSDVRKAIGSRAKSGRDLFRRSGIWKVLVHPGATKGTIRLAID